MSRGRLMGVALVLTALAVVSISSYVTMWHGRSAPEDRAARLGDAGSTPASGMLDTAGLAEFWHQRVQRNPADYISYTELGAAFLRRARETGDVDSYSRAEAAIRNALDVNPRYETAISYLGSVLYAKHDFAGALENAQRVLSLNPGLAQALALVGDANLELGRYPEATSSYDKLGASSHVPPVLSRLARLNEVNGRPRDAIELMGQAASEADDSDSPPETKAWYHLQLGNLYFNIGDIGSAEAQYNSSLQAFPNYVHALAGLGRVAAASGDYNRAIDLYTAVVGRQPIPEYVAALGDIYRVAGRPDEAAHQYGLIDAIDKLYKANGINTDLQMALYFADHNLRLNEAESQARAEYQRRPSIQVADVLAWTLYKEGRYDEAPRYSREALRLGTQDPLILFHAGMINYEAGVREAARDYLSRAIQINPSFSILYGQQARTTLEALQNAGKR